MIEESCDSDNESVIDMTNIDEKYPLIFDPADVPDVPEIPISDDDIMSQNHDPNHNHNLSSDVDMNIDTDDDENVLFGNDHETPIDPNECNIQSVQYSDRRTRSGLCFSSM